MSAAIVIDRGELLARLQAQLEVAKRYDADRLKAHRKDELAALADFRALLRDALKWNYQTVKSIGYGGLRMEAPSCPMSMAAVVDMAIRQVSATSRPRWKVSESSMATKRIYNALTFSPDAIPGGLC